MITNFISSGIPLSPMLIVFAFFQFFTFYIGEAFEMKRRRRWKDKKIITKVITKCQLGAKFVAIDNVTINQPLNVIKENKYTQKSIDAQSSLP